MGEAFIVQADDPSAITFNPAGLAQLEGNQLNVQGTLCNGFTRYESPSGEISHNKDQWQLVPAFFVTSDLGQTNMSAGLGVSLPNGLSSEWPKDSFARYVCTYSDLTVADISPAFGMRVRDRLMIGGGVDYYYSKADLKRMLDAGLPAGAPGAMDVESELEGDGSAWGLNVGAIYRINPRHGVALTYRQPYTIEYDGDIRVGDNKSDIAASIDFPAVVVAGYAFRPSDKWKIEFNLDWTQWEQVGDIVVRFKTPGAPDSVMAEDLENTFAYKLGAEYAYSKRLDLRCGYIYNENATPEATWRPSQPDTVTHFFLTGFGYKLKKVTLDGALQFVYYEKRTIDNNVDLNETFSSSSVDGTYRTWAPCVSLSATYRF
jgi:long-chain fatty acid transport protein